MDCLRTLGPGQLLSLPESLGEGIEAGRQRYPRRPSLERGIVVESKYTVDNSTKH